MPVRPERDKLADAIALLARLETHALVLAGVGEDPDVLAMMVDTAQRRVERLRAQARRIDWTKPEGDEPA